MTDHHPPSDAVGAHAGSTNHSDDARLRRYARQWQYPAIGREGQQRLLESRVLVCGCGALGSVLANTLARAGIGHLRIVDRDFLELNNLQRQVLYDEADVAAHLPKAIAAAEKLRRINSDIEIEPIVADVDSSNVEALCRDVDLIVDGTDNFEIRFLLNDVAVKHGIAWVFGGCLGTEGQSVTILPGETPCLRCLFEEPPPSGSTPTCDTAGILGPIINIIASIEAMEAIKILTGHTEAVRRTLLVVELWHFAVREIGLDAVRREGRCPVCHDHRYEWLEGRRGSHSAVLCGRNAVQLSPPDRHPISLDEMARKLAGVAHVERNRFLLRATIGDHVLTLFPDGRAIIGGTEDVATARSLYAKYVGT